MSENNESATQNADVAFQLRAIGQHLELLSRTYKDLKDEVNSIEQQNSGADRRGKTVRMAVRNVKSVGQGIRSRPNRARRNVNFCGMDTYEDMDGDLDTIKLKIPNFKVKTIPRLIWSGRKR
jgi:hypothetical protein